MAMIHLKHWSMRVHRKTCGSGSFQTKAASQVSGSTTSQPQIISTVMTNRLSPAPRLMPTKQEA